MTWNFNRALIPNEEFLEVDILLNDGRCKRTEIEVFNGLHRLKDISITEVKAWKRVSKEWLRG